MKGSVGHKERNQHRGGCMHEVALSVSLIGNAGSPWQGRSDWSNPARRTKQRTETRDDDTVLFFLFMLRWWHLQRKPDTDNNLLQSFAKSWKRFFSASSRPNILQFYRLKICRSTLLILANIERLKPLCYIDMCQSSTTITEKKC